MKRAASKPAPAPPVPPELLELADLLAREDGMRQRKRQRAADSGRSIPVVAIVGYTNAGKSLLICMATACL